MQRGLPSEAIRSHVKDDQDINRTISAKAVLKSCYKCMTHAHLEQRALDKI
jgi:hypothetical protein